VSERAFGFSGEEQPTTLVYYLPAVCTIDGTLREERRVPLLSPHRLICAVRVFANLSQFTYRKMPFSFERSRIMY
jgi:hypothetical protein